MPKERKKRIFLVEDEAVLVLSLETMLETLGFELVGHADNYQDALSQIRAEKPDAVLLDIKIKGEKTGIQVAEELFKEQKTALIFLTANADKLNFDKARKTLPFAFLEKPVREKELETALNLAIMQSEFQESRKILQDRVSRLEIKGQETKQLQFLFSEVLPPLLDAYEKLEELLESGEQINAAIQYCAHQIKSALSSLAAALGEQEAQTDD